jgi:hypothetical protein
MNKKIKAIIALILIILIAVPITFFYINEGLIYVNKNPVVEIKYPYDGATVSKIVIISGITYDSDSDDSLLEVEIKIDDEWHSVEGNEKWSYEWSTYNIEEGIYSIQVRSWDGTDYSEIEEIKVKVYNPNIIESDAHKWAIFVAASNFPSDNESKLGNGPLFLAEEMASYFIENLKYSTNNIIILFDDGWVREDNGFGRPIETLQERSHEYDITYAAATMKNVVTAMEYIKEQSNKFSDSEIFVWFSSHGCGDINQRLFGGKLLQRSGIFLWDELLNDNELGAILSGFKSDKTCVIIDACFSGGFADKTILNFQEFFLLKSNIPKSGRVVITGASKYRPGYASILTGPLFSQLWFYGLKSGDADGYKPFILKLGRPTRLSIFKDGKVSVEEAFYYASHTLRTNRDLKDFSKMQPQINDQYPKRGFIRSLKGLVLGQ